MEVYNLKVDLNGKNPEFFDRFVESYGGRDAILAEFKPFYVDEFDRRRAIGASVKRAYGNANEALNEMLLHLAREHGFWDERITVEEKYPDVDVFKFLALNMPWNIREFIHGYGGMDILTNHFQTVSEIEYARRRKRKEKRQDAKRKARELQNWMALRAAREMGFLPYSCATGMTKVTQTPINVTKPAAPVKTEHQGETKSAILSTVAEVKNTEMFLSNEMPLAASVKENVQVPLQTAGSGMEKAEMHAINAVDAVQTPNKATQIANSESLITGIQSTPRNATQFEAIARLIAGIHTTPSNATQLEAIARLIARIKTTPSNATQPEAIARLIAGIQTTPSNATQLEAIARLITGSQSPPSNVTLLAANEKLPSDAQPTPNNGMQLAIRERLVNGEFGNIDNRILSLKHLHSVLLSLTVTDIGISRFASFRHANVAAILAQEAAAYTLHARLSVRAPNAQTLQIQVRPFGPQTNGALPFDNAGTNFTELLVTMTTGNVSDGCPSTLNVKASGSSVDSDRCTNPVLDFRQTFGQEVTENERRLAQLTGIQRSMPSIRLPDFCYIKALTPVFLSADQFVRPCEYSPDALTSDQRLLRSAYMDLSQGSACPLYRDDDKEISNKPTTQDDDIFKMSTKTKEDEVKTYIKQSARNDVVIESVEKPKDAAAACAAKSEKTQTVSSRILGFFRRWCCSGPKKTPKETEV